MSMSKAIDPAALSACESKQELMKAYLTAKRSSEDILLLEMEMNNTPTYYSGNTEAY